MKIRYRRRVSLGKHIKLNISKSGISTSIKVGRTTVNPQRNKITYNTPIKGLSIESKIVDDKKTEGRCVIETYILMQIIIYGFIFIWFGLLAFVG